MEESGRERDISELKYFDYASLIHTLQSTQFIGLTAKNQSLKNNFVAAPGLNKKQSNSGKKSGLRGEPKSKTPPF